MNHSMNAYTNESRACRAELALKTYTKACVLAYPLVRQDGYSLEPIEDRIGDLIADLLHLAASEMQEGSSIAALSALLNRALIHYGSEVEESTAAADSTAADSTAATAADSAADSAAAR